MLVSTVVLLKIAASFITLLGLLVYWLGFARTKQLSSDSRRQYGQKRINCKQQPTSRASPAADKIANSISNSNEELERPLSGPKSQQQQKQQQQQQRQKRKKAEPQPDRTRDLEPSMDEIDESLLDIFCDPANQVTSSTSNNKQQKLSKKQANAPNATSSSNQSKCADFQAEKLMEAIASSHLARDQIELAVGTLLERLESGESDWRPPRSDTLGRMRARLRERDAALALEQQQHELTRARLAEQRAASSASKIGQREASSALDKLQCELDEERKRRSVQQDDNLKLTNLREQDQARLKELERLKADLERRNNQLRTQAEQLEPKLRAAERQLEANRLARQREDYERAASLADSNADRSRMEKTLSEQLLKLRVLADSNRNLEQRLQESQAATRQLEEKLCMLSESKHLSESALQRSLNEMRIRQESLERNLGPSPSLPSTDLNQLRRQLAAILPELKVPETGDWIQAYLGCFRAMAAKMHKSGELNFPTLQVSVPIGSSASVSSNGNSSNGNSSSSSKGNGSANRFASAKVEPIF